MKVGPTYPLGLTYLVQNLGHHFPSIPNTCRGEGMQGCGGRVVKQHGRKQKSLQEKKKLAGGLLEQSLPLSRKL